MFGDEEKKVKLKYSGPTSDFTGYGEANRNYIVALHTAGVDLTIDKISYTSLEADYGAIAELISSLEGKILDYDIKILHIPSDNYIKYLEPTKYHIGHLFWETDGMSDSWVWNCNRMDEIWTGANIHKENFLQAGVKIPIYVFPQPVDTTVEPTTPFQVTGHRGYMFYSIFQWIERKNPKGLLMAYWKEFEGNEDVTLLLKVYRFGFDTEQRNTIKQDIQKWKEESGIVNFPRVVLCFELMNTTDMIRLHSTGDCFVSAHRGEGWGRPQAEALALGKPIISTNLGGIHEWLEDNKTALLVKWKEIPVFNMEFAPWYGTDQGWAEPDEEDLRKKMRFCFEHQAEAAEVGRRGREMIKAKLSYQVVGELLKNRLIDIQRIIDTTKKSREEIIKERLVTEN